jgi:transposase
MLSVGIDAHLDEHQIEIQKENGQRLWKKRVENNKHGLDELCRQLEEIKRSTGDMNVVGIFTEAIGSYFAPFQYHLTQRGYRVVIVNPMRVISARTMKNLGKSKNDRIDASTLASLPWMDVGYQENDSHQRYAISNLTRLHQKMQHNETRLVNYLRADLAQIFPEFSQQVKDIDTKTVFAILEKYPTPTLLINIPVEELARLISQNSRGGYDKDFAKKIEELAENSIGVPDNDGIFAYRIRFYIKQINEIKKSLKELESEITRRTDNIDEIKMIDDIKGIQRIRAASIYGEIGPINQFESARKLQGYGGITPKMKQSAKKEWVGRPTKIANHYLREATSVCAKSLALHSEEFREVYFRERTKGKSDTQAFIVIGNRLLYHVFSMLKNKKPYRKRMPQQISNRPRPFISRRESPT